MDDAIVIDVGGTTTDLGVLQSGFPRESGVAVTIGGVRTNFRMPDVVSIGLGGGSIVREHEDGRVTVGPDSVGYEITKHALVFGGDVMTATDIAVRLGMAEVGDASKVAHIDEAFANKALAVMRELVEEGIDMMKVSNDDIDAILVGGGCIILPTDLAGTAACVKPEHSGCANAIGSAISKVSGTYEALVDYDVTPREQALAAAREAAIAQAVAAGAIRETVEIDRLRGRAPAILSGPYQPREGEGCGRFGAVKKPAISSLRLRDERGVCRLRRVYHAEQGGRTFSSGRLAVEGRAAVYRADGAEGPGFAAGANPGSTF